MKFSGISLLLPLTLSAFEQPLPPQAFQHGVRAGAQTVVLFEDDGAPSPRNACLLVATVAGGRALYILNGGNGHDLFVASAGDLSSLDGDRATPCVQFDTWVEQLPEDYAESVIAGFSNAEHGSSKTTFERYVQDNLRLIYVSYKITVEKSPNGAYRVEFSAPTGRAPADLRPRGDWKMV